MLVHLGTEPESKYYQLLDPVNKKVIVSRNVIFEERKIWDWKKCEEDNDAGTLHVEFGEYGNHGIDEEEGDVITHEPLINNEGVTAE